MVIFIRFCNVSIINYMREIKDLTIIRIQPSALKSILHAIAYMRLRQFEARGLIFEFIFLTFFILHSSITAEQSFDHSKQPIL